MKQTPEELETMKQAAVVAGVPEIILKRWSPRAFADKPIGVVELRAVFTGAQWAASSNNEQPWRFLVGQRGEGQQGATYSLILGTLVEGNQSWAKSAPVLILSVARKSFSNNGKPNRHAMHDTGAAVANLALTATALGLHTHSMAGFDPEKARVAFSIPAEFEAVAVTALGYLGDPETLEGVLHERELAPRERKPLKEIVFAEAWENSAGF